MSENSHFEANSQNFAKNNRDFLHDPLENQLQVECQSCLFNPRYSTIVGKPDAKIRCGTIAEHGFREAGKGPEMP